MSLKVAFLNEILSTQVAVVWALLRVSLEVVSNAIAFVINSAAVRESASELSIHSASPFVPNVNNLEIVLGHSFKLLSEEFSVSPDQTLGLFAHITHRISHFLGSAFGFLMKGARVIAVLDFFKTAGSGDTFFYFKACCYGQRSHLCQLLTSIDLGLNSVAAKVK